MRRRARNRADGDNDMIRKAFLMSLKPGNQAEYERRHNPIWPELQDVLRGHGVRNYSIFLDRETGTLFAYAEIESEELWAKIAQTDVCRRWWAHMRDLMLTNDDNSPVAVNLDEVFHLD
jgi:L-rhamnose mutarotase